MVLPANGKCKLLERNCVTRFELSIEIFNAMYAASFRISLFMTYKDRHNLCMNCASLDRESIVGPCIVK